MGGVYIFQLFLQQAFVTSKNNIMKVANNEKWYIKSRRKRRTSLESACGGLKVVRIWKASKISVAGSSE